MGRTRIAIAKVENLKKEIEECKEKQRTLVKHAQILEKQWHEAKISYSEYKKHYNERHKGKSIKEWFESYDNYIKEVKKLIKKEERKIFRHKILFGISIFLVFLILTFILFKVSPAIVGFITQEQEFTQTIDFEATESTTYEWQIENPGILNSIKLSGLIEGEGEVKIYFDDLLILDREKLPKGKEITGQIIKDEEKRTPNVFQKIIGFFTGKIVEEESYSEDEDTSNVEEAPPKEDLSPSPGEFPSSETDEIEKEPEEPEIPEEVKEEPKSSKEFSKICEETCDLSKLNLNKSSYTLRIEIENARLKLNEIVYEITPFSEKPEEIPENITEKPEEIPENITESIQEINITKPKENITEAPILIKKIPNKEIQKNTSTILDMTEFFTNAENFYLLQVQNISTTSQDHTIKLIPDKEFIGMRTSKIIASNSYGEAESNFFNITVTEFVKVPVLIKEIPDINIQKNSFIEINVSEYFLNAEHYFFLQIQNISTTTFDHVIKLQPDVDFTGTRMSKIIASNNFGETHGNFFNIIVSEANITIPENITANATIFTIQHQARIGQPVRWTKKISTTAPINLTLELPENSEKISIKKIEGDEEEDITSKSTITGKVISGEGKVGITGKAVSEEETEGKGIISRFYNFLINFFRKLFRITGKAIQETEQNVSVEIELNTTGEYEVEYETPAPEAFEETTERGKKITISGPETIHYENVLAYTELPKEAPIERIHLYHLINETRKQINFSSFDINNNSLIDYIEWLVPNLSNETYELIIEISKAEHLDENYTFVSDIYEQVKALDDNWSEPIQDKHFVRVTFEKNLTNEKDITLYPRVVNGSPKIEVYEQNKTEKIAEFSSITSNEYNKIYLTNLQGEQDTFDLKIVGGSVEFDYIIDPTQEWFEECDTIDIEWTVNGWTAGGGTCTATNGASETMTRTTDLTGRTNAYLNFTWNVNKIDAGEFLTVYAGTSVGTLEQVFQVEGNGEAQSGTQGIDISSYISSTTSIRAECKSGGGESCTWDDINLSTITPTDEEYPQFSNYWDNNGSLVNSGTGLFNVTITSTNGTVLLEINNTNVTARNLTANVYNASYSFISNGTYSYKWISWGNGTAKNFNVSNTQYYTVNASVNTAPQIISVYNNSIDLSSGPNEAPALTSVIVNFTAYDSNGVGDLNDSTARINFTKSDEDTRENLTCSKYQSSGNYANYTCNVTMWWWDGTGTWNITAYIEDNQTNNAMNTSTNFYVGLRTSFVMGPSALTWPGISPGATNQTSNNDPLLLNNTGNADIDINEIEINATNLFGEENPSFGLWAGNFSVAPFTGSSKEECNSSATTMNASVYTNITGALLPAGNFTKNDGTGQEELYFCLRKIGSELTDQAYSTLNQGAWTIRILLVAISIKGASKLKKRKKKKKQKNRIIGELSIPVTIFTKKIGALEAITKYLKENLEMSYHEIAEILNRNDRTIWTAYNKAIKKQKELIEIKKTLVFIPTSIFKNRKLTILESTTVYLKQKGLKYNEIAKLVNRDQRNIWTIYSKAIKKLGRESKV